MRLIRLSPLRRPGPLRARIRRALLPVLAAVVLPALTVAGCTRGVPEELQPDSILRAELDMGDDDEVHTVRISGGAAETLDPAETVIPPGAWVQFVTADAFVHEVRFDVEALPPAAAEFLSSTDQIASPPLLDAGARFVISFRDAPEGRYPFVAEGNGAPARGVVVVQARN